MNDNFPNTQVEEDNSILALIGGQRLKTMTMKKGQNEELQMQNIPKPTMTAS